MQDKLWMSEPPEASAEEWTRVCSRLVDAMPVDEEGNVLDRDRLLRFVLDDCVRRCQREAETREPGILQERLRREFRDAAAQIDEFIE